MSLLQRLDHPFVVRPEPDPRIGIVSSKEYTNTKLHGNELCPRWLDTAGASARDI